MHMYLSLSFSLSMYIYIYQLEELPEEHCRDFFVAVLVALLGPGPHRSPPPPLRTPRGGEGTVD